MPVSLAEKYLYQDKTQLLVHILLISFCKKRQKSILTWLLFLGQLVHYSRANITWMLKAKQSSEIALYPMLQLFINN